MASKEYQKLKEKIKKEYNDFAVSIEKLDKRTIIEKAKEIYIMQEVKWYLKLKIYLYQKKHWHS